MSYSQKFILIAILLESFLPLSDPLRNRACRNASRLNANFCQSNVAPIICRWKLVKRRYCFGDNELVVKTKLVYKRKELLKHSQQADLS